jgi:putative transposase
LLSCGRHIERNPVAANLVAHAWEYRWSSSRACALGESDGLLPVNPWYEQLAVEPSKRQVLWRDFLEGEDPKERAIAADDWAIGEPEFRRGLYRPQSQAVPRVNGGPRA